MVGTARFILVIPSQLVNSAKQRNANVESFINKSDFHELLNSLVKLKDKIEDEVILDA